MLLIISSLFISLLFIFYLKSIFCAPKKSLNGKHVLITGGSSGIGKSLGKYVAKLGAHVTILARDVNKLNSAKEEILKCVQSSTQQIKAVSLDVTNSHDVERVLKEIDKSCPIYSLITCAGMAICGKIEDLRIEDMKKLVDLNIFGSIYCIHALLPAMKLREEGMIVLFGSQASLLGIYGLGMYSATKYALRGFAESLDMEVRAHNISVTLALPPDTDTPGFENENKSKPQATHLISETGGLVSPDNVAENVIKDALKGKFFSYVGFESFMLTTLCIGMTPFISIFEVIYQSFFIGLFRLISSFYILKFQKIVRDLKNSK